jgi:hypothetical protein
MFCDRDFNNTKGCGPWFKGLIEEARLANSEDVMSGATTPNPFK